MIPEISVNQGTIKMRTWTADHHYAATIAFKNDSNGEGTRITTDIPTAFVFYAIIAILVMIVVLIVKLMWDINVEEPESATENSGLLSPKEGGLISYSSYGATSSCEEDIESGKGSCSSSSSTDDLYNEKICVICYDHQRNCFFVPCGHCVACHNCAKRIMSEEMKMCPICRTYIDKVREFHIL